MKIRKLIAGFAAMALTASAIGVSAFAEDILPPVSYENPTLLINADELAALPNIDKLYSADTEVTFNLTVNDMNFGWNNGSAGIVADGFDGFVETKFGGVECDKEANRSWFPEGSKVIQNDDKEATVVVKADLTGKSNFNIFIFSGQPGQDPNGAFVLNSVTIKNPAGFEATYADGKITGAEGSGSGDVGGDTTIDPATADFKATLGGQLDSSFNATVGEWPADAEAYGDYTKEVTISWDFGAEKVKLAGNYLGIKTNAPFNTDEGAENATVTVSSIKADDRDVAFDASKVFVGDNDSEAGTIKITLMNEWDENVKGNAAVDFNAVNGEEGFSKLSVTFAISEIPGASTEAPSTEAPSTEAPATEAPSTEAPATEAPSTEAPATSAAGDTNTTTPDKGNADTGVEGVAVVAGLAVVATLGVVIAKKRK